MNNYRVKLLYYSGESKTVYAGTLGAARQIVDAAVNVFGVQIARQRGHDGAWCRLVW